MVESTALFTQNNLEMDTSELHLVEFDEITISRNKGVDKMTTLKERILKEMMVDDPLETFLEMIGTEETIFDVDVNVMEEGDKMIYIYPKYELTLKQLLEMVVFFKVDPEKIRIFPKNEDSPFIIEIPLVASN